MKAPRFCLLLALAALPARGDSVVVFNELHYHPPGAETTNSEWLELRNQTSVDIDMSGWSLAEGVTFTFPEGTIIPARGYLLVTATLGTVPGALGPWSGKLDNGGEDVVLQNNNGRVMDRLDYKTDGKWPVAPDGAGPTLARRAMNLATDEATSWAASRQVGGTPGADNFPATASAVITPVLGFSDSWKLYSAGSPPAAWKDASYDDSGWASGTGSFRLGSAVLPAPATVGSSLPSGPISYFFRKSFAFSGQPSVTQLRLRLLVDDGAAVFLNGFELVRANLTADAAADARALQMRRADPVIQEFLVPGLALVNGNNVLAVEVHQAAQLPTYPQAIINSGPVAYWRLGEDSGTLADLADLSGSPESGAQAGSFAGFTPANLALAGPRPSESGAAGSLLGFEDDNRAPSFQGNGDGGNDVAVFPDSGVMNFSAGKKFSFEAWVKIPASGVESNNGIVAKGGGNGGEQFSCDLFNGKYRFYVWNGGSPNTAAVAQSNVAPDDTWQHVVGVFDRSQSLMRLYVNGVQAASATPPSTLLSTTHEVSVGSRKSSGSSSYDYNLLGKVDEVSLYDRALTAAEISTHYNAAFVAGSTAHDTSDAVFGLALDTVVTPQPVSLVFNEVAAGGTNTGAVIELANPGSSAVDLGGIKLARYGDSGSQTRTLATQSLAAGGFIAFDTATLFPIADGDKLVLTSATGVSLDSAEVKNSARGRSPDGRGDWFRLTATTFGAPNVVSLHDEIVINEIMFHPPSPPLSAAATGGQWIELFNRSASAVDLSGWALGGGIDYEFPFGTTIEAGGYLVVAANPASMPGVAALGPWDGSLSRNSDRIELKDPLGNRADEAVYYSGGYWSAYADGGGSSLELVNPRADRMHPQSWAASDESSKAAWQTFTWRGVASPGMPSEPTKWNEIDLCLLDGPGEVLIDDVRVTDTTSGSNLIENGNFNNGLNKWRATGTHRQTRVESEAGGNSVLRVIATDAGEYQGNQIESSFINDTPLVSGREYEISLRARWLAGAGRLNARLYFNRLARSFDLAMVARGGTPGAPNSRALANLGPSVTALAHSPVVPAASQPFVVSASIADPDNVSAAILKYAVNGGSWQSVPMSAEGSRFSAPVPGQVAAAVVQFYIEATDSLGALSLYPPGGPSSRALCAVQDGQAASGPTSKVRLVMTNADATFMHATLNCLSNANLGATIIADESEVYYDIGARLKGSFVGRNVPRVGFSLDFQPDRPFRGVHPHIAIDRSQHAAIAQGEIIVKHIASKAGGIPNMYDDLARFVHVLPTYSSSCQVRMSGFGDDYLKSSFPDGDDGPMYEYESLRWTKNTSTGTYEGIKLPGSDYVNPDLQDLGDDKEAYRWSYLLSNRAVTDDFSGAIATGKLFSMSGTSFDAEAKRRLDVNQWLRGLAFQTLVGPGDTIFTGGNIHNIRFYQRPNDARMLYMPWDWDSAWGRGTSEPLIGGGNVAKLITTTPHNRRQFLFHVHDLVTNVFNTSYMTRWTQHYGAVAGESYSSILNYIGSRATSALSQLPASVSWTSSAGTVAADGTVTLSGTAYLNIASIEVNGLIYPPVWTSNTTWTVVIPLAAGPNALVVRGLDKNGQPVSGASNNLNVTNPNAAAAPAILINEWLADNESGPFDPADSGNDDWIELYNPGNSPVNLSDWSLSDTPSTPRLAVLPPGTVIPAHGFLLLWADDAPEQGSATAPHLAFKLSKDGDAIRLYAPDTRLIDSVSFGAQATDLSEGRYRDGGEEVYPLSEPTPGSANVLLYPTQSELVDGAFRFRFSTTAGRRYRVEYSTDLIEWLPLTEDTIASGEEMLVSDPVGEGGRRYYRAVLLAE